MEQKGIAMRLSFAVLLLACLIAVPGCTPAKPGKEKPIIHCPACGTELDAIFQKNF